jgi:cytochrome P450
MPSASVAANGMVRAEWGRRPPGPPAYRLFRTLREMRRDPLRLLGSMSERYGDVVYIRFLTIPVYLIRHPDHVRHVLQERHTIYDKDTFDYHMLKPLVGEGLLTSNGAPWLRARRLIQPAFHRERLAALGTLMSERILAMLERWRPMVASNQPFDVAEEMTRLTLDVVTRALFGADLSHETDAITRGLVTFMQHVLERISSPLALLPPLPTPGNLRARAAVRGLDRVVAGIIATRRRRAADTGDLLSMLLLARDEETGEGMTDRQLRDEVMTLLLAGHETTANALNWTWCLLAQHPEATGKLAAELTHVLGGRTPSMADRPQLTYTRMVVEEAMRLYPPAWIVPRGAREDDEIAGFGVRAGSVVLLSPYLTHRHPGIWENPERFDPERFTPERAAARPRFAYFPFGGGPRLCIGNAFAMTEAQLAVATVAQRYRLDLLPGQRVRPEPLVTLRPSGGLPMTVRPR